MPKSSMKSTRMSIRNETQFSHRQGSVKRQVYNLILSSFLHDEVCSLALQLVIIAAQNSCFQFPSISLCNLRLVAPTPWLRQFWFNETQYSHRQGSVKRQFHQVFFTVTFVISLFSLLLVAAQNSSFQFPCEIFNLLPPHLGHDECGLTPQRFSLTSTFTPRFTTDYISRSVKFSLCGLQLLAHYSSELTYFQRLQFILTTYL